jgi:hypothetical protein
VGQTEDIDIYRMSIIWREMSGCCVSETVLLPNDTVCDVTVRDYRSWSRTENGC